MAHAHRRSHCRSGLGRDDGDHVQSQQRRRDGPVTIVSVGPSPTASMSTTRRTQPSRKAGPKPKRPETSCRPRRGRSRTASVAAGVPAHRARRVVLHRPRRLGRAAGRSGRRRGRGRGRPAVGDLRPLGPPRVPFHYRPGVWAFGPVGVALLRAITPVGVLAVMTLGAAAPSIVGVVGIVVRTATHPVLPRRLLRSAGVAVASSVWALRSPTSPHGTWRSTTQTGTRRPLERPTCWTTSAMHRPCGASSRSPASGRCHRCCRRGPTSHQFSTVRPTRSGLYAVRARSGATDAMRSKSMSW